MQPPTLETGEVSTHIGGPCSQEANHYRPERCLFDVLRIASEAEIAALGDDHRHHYSDADEDPVEMNVQRADLNDVHRR